MVKLADEIRDHAMRQYVNPARRKGAVVPSTVTINSGDIVRNMKLQQRVPAVCGALDAQKFLKDNSLKLLRRTGPKHGMTVTWRLLV